MTTKKPRSTPSQANPSILLGQKVETEDDILHIKDLPTFDGTLGAKDCEIMLQYLTTPYIRIPLLLNFFSVEHRLKALRSRELQDVLDAAMFEPGMYRSTDSVASTQIPSTDRDHLCSPVGLLFNEIIMSPNIILSIIQIMLENVVEMDSGNYTDLSGSILYVVRLAVRVEGFLLFLIKNKEYHKSQAELLAKDANYKQLLNGANQEATVRGLDCDDDVTTEATKCQKRLRTLIDEKVFVIIARWIKTSKKEGNIGLACMLHAHLAYLNKNMEYEQLNARIVFSSLASQIYLFNNIKYDLDIDPKYSKKMRKDSSQDISVDLIIPQVELFDMYQRNRSKILKWLIANEAERSIVSCY
jgi:hypothetical protein